MARKNANGEGSRPRQRPDGRWEARYWKDGKQRSVYGKTRKDAADKLNEALAHKDDPPTFVPTDITVREFFVQYEQVARDTMKKRRYETVRYVARVHLLPALGDYRLKGLTREGIQRLMQGHRFHDIRSRAVTSHVTYELLGRQRQPSPTPTYWATRSCDMLHVVHDASITTNCYAINRAQQGEGTGLGDIQC